MVRPNMLRAPDILSGVITPPNNNRNYTLVHFTDRPAPGAGDVACLIVCDKTMKGHVGSAQAQANDGNSFAIPPNMEFWVHVPDGQNLYIAATANATDYSVQGWYKPLSVPTGR